jgi:hypothetical protein
MNPSSKQACRPKLNFRLTAFSEVGSEVRLVASCLLWRGISHGG